MKCVFWLTLMAPAALLMVIVWRLASPVLGGALSRATRVLHGGKLWGLAMWIIELVREQATLRAALPAPIDLSPQEICRINWWTLRNAGFDCLRAAGCLPGPCRRLTGRPWRVLTKDTVIRIPVIRKHLGGDRVGTAARGCAAAYCRLIKTCEGGECSLRDIDVRRFLRLPGNSQHMQRSRNSSEHFERFRSF